MEPAGAKRARLEVLEEIRHQKLECQLNWKINDFVNWASFLENGHRENSSVFEFKVPEVENLYKFSLRLKTSGDPGDNSSFKHVGLCLVNRNVKKINANFQLCLLNYQGSPWKERMFRKTFNADESWGPVKFVVMEDLRSHPTFSLPEGCLSIQCNLTIFHSTFSVAGGKRCQESMKKLMSDATCSDFQIVCDGKTFPCHRNILANQSNVLAEMMKAEKWTEGKDNTLEIKDFGKVTVQSAIHFIYCGEIPEDSKASADLLLFADKYNVEKMVEVCQADLSNSLDVGNVLSVLEVANLVSGAEPLKEKAISFVAKNVKMLKKSPEWNRFMSPELVDAVLERVVT